LHAAFHDINDLGLAAPCVDASGGDDDHRQEGPPVGGAIGANVRASICGGRRQASLYGRVQLVSPGLAPHSQHRNFFALSAAALSTPRSAMFMVATPSVPSESAPGMAQILLFILCLADGVLTLAAPAWL
jgi:hypothetical protein